MKSDVDEKLFHFIFSSLNSWTKIDAHLPSHTDAQWQSFHMFYCLLPSTTIEFDSSQNQVEQRLMFCRFNLTFLARLFFHSFPPFIVPLNWRRHYVCLDFDFVLFFFHAHEIERRNTNKASIVLSTPSINFKCHIYIVGHWKMSIKNNSKRFRSVESKCAFVCPNIIILITNFLFPRVHLRWWSMSTAHTLTSNGEAKQTNRNHCVQSKEKKTFSDENDFFPLQKSNESCHTFIIATKRRVTDGEQQSTK